MVSEDGLHVVSRVILRRFCDNHQLCRYRLDYRQCKSVGPDGAGRSDRLHPQDPDGFEQEWKKVEDRLPAALADLDARGLSGNETALDTLRRCVVLHWTRSHTIIKAHDRAIERVRRVAPARLGDHPDVEQEFQRQYSGLYPAGREGRGLVLNALLDEAFARFKASSESADSMLRWYQRQVASTAGAAITVCEATSGQFLIGDVPVVDLRAGSAGLLAMPVDPRHVLALGAYGGGATLDQEQVEVLNLLQVRQAYRAVMWHPSAGLKELVDRELASVP